MGLTPTLPEAVGPPVDVDRAESSKHAHQLSQSGQTNIAVSRTSTRASDDSLTQPAGEKVNAPQLRERFTPGPVVRGVDEEPSPRLETVPGVETPLLEITV